MAAKKRVRKQGKPQRAALADAIGRPVSPHMVADLQEKIAEATAVMYQLNGALRYEQRRLAAKERRELYVKILGAVSRGAKTGAAAASHAVASAGGRIKAGATWLFTHKQVDPETATA